MTQRVVATQVTEAASRPAPGRSVADLRGEVLARPSVAAPAVAALVQEALAWPTPDTATTALLAEALAWPVPAIDAPTFLLEVLRRDTAASAIIVSGMDAYGDQAWPIAQRGVFALRHNWAEPLVERLEWRTSVTRLANGGEARQALRLTPRRFMTCKAGHGRATDALLADWLADHLGQRAMWPLHQYAAHVSTDAMPGAFMLDTAGQQPQHFMPLAADPVLTDVGVQGWGAGSGTEAERWALILSGNDWQAVQLQAVDGAGFWLAEPLARYVHAGSAVMPLVWGVCTEAASLAQWAPGIADGSVTAQVEPAPPSAPGPADPMLDGLPVWPDGNWAQTPTATVEATLTRQDYAAADPWVRRDDPWPTTGYQRRYLAASLADIEAWRQRLWRTQGRLHAFWLPDGLAPILSVTAAADPEDGYLRVKETEGTSLSAFWHRPAACAILHPDGTRQHVLTSVCHSDQGGALVLRSPLGAAVPAGSRIVRLARCRLDHDAIDLQWHTPALVEIALTARHLAEPLGDVHAPIYCGWMGWR